MTDQFTQPKDVLGRSMLIILTMILISLALLMGWYFHQLSDPYVKEVLSIKGDITRGQAMFEINCAGCHWLQGDDSVGPSLHNVHQHKSKIAIIHQVTGGQTPPMPKFQPNTQEMADLLSYLENI
ncbi:MAG TPA: cytochrome C [Cyanothece sp. UBA12306]|nr:cytochrome C [Cyanothece sp. UBA12306]